PVRSVCYSEGAMAGAELAVAAKILVVDDDDAILRMIEARLGHAGYRVTAVSSAAAALEVLAAEHVDLVLLDLMMPGTDGYAALQAIRARRPFGALPVIILSARDLGDDVIRALRLGANDYAVKPVDFDVLLRRIAV